MRWQIFQDRERPSRDHVEEGEYDGRDIHPHNVSDLIRLLGEPPVVWLREEEVPTLLHWSPKCWRAVPPHKELLPRRYSFFFTSDSSPTPSGNPYGMVYTCWSQNHRMCLIPFADADRRLKGRPMLPGHTLLLSHALSSMCLTLLHIEIWMSGK